MEKGIVIIALGHPNYGKMAAALTASIRCMNTDIPVVLLSDESAGSHLTDEERKLFSSVIYPHKEYYTTLSGEFSPLKPRVYLNELSPFEKTLAIDADQLWIQGNDPAEAFEEMDGKAFTMSNAGHTITDENADPSKSQWGNIQEIIAAYGIPNRKFYKVFAEWFYFEKNEFSRQLFTEAQNVFTEPPKCRTIRFIGQPITEELAFCIAMARLSIYPHKENWLPSFWYFREPDKSGSMPFELKEQYYTYSLGGNTTPEWHVNIYNNLAAYAYQTLKLKWPYSWKNKKDFIPEREKF